ncbi:hypothetical protein OG909_30845 [Streptomyces sp. NBC_01754]|uniref:hypothetical protein n=1 Tax=Streptomyces sp. NBC_01754 TaxID=2975930 RepID=UPI002DD7D85E|nr:hypothetical protein [Streptomyces sp. NBC_01754]WSC96349.1 hypothetical protein OG909_30845 [Streptomyces sp. NBC_01754]
MPVPPVAVRVWVTATAPVGVGMLVVTRRSISVVAAVRADRLTVGMLMPMTHGNPHRSEFPDRESEAHPSADLKDCNEHGYQLPVHLPQNY